MPRSHYPTKASTMPATPSQIETTTPVSDPESDPSPIVNPAPLTLLIQGCEALGIPITPEQVAQFERYYVELVTWNKMFNLTAITEHGDVQNKHFLDSLLGLLVLAEEMDEPLPMRRPLHAIDVGTGAGFPGVALKIMWPALRLTLLDGTGKKILFLNELVKTLGLTQVNVVQGRAEEAGRDESFRGQFDLVTARAVAPLNTLAEYLLPFARRDGYVLAYKGPGVPEEFMAARKAIDLLGGETVRLAPMRLPNVDEERFLMLIKKVQRTPPIYPRGQGLPRKKPLG